MNIFPSVAVSVSTSAATAAALPVAREVMWDFAENRPVFRAGNPLTVTGLEAVKVWCWKALHTRRYVHEIYSPGYGCDAWELIGQAFSEQLKTSEAARYVRECLLINKYVTDVKDVSVSFLGEALSISCTVVTIYGEATVNV